MKNILVIGSEGFIGHSCVVFFKQNGWDVYGCDLIDYPKAVYNYIKISRLQPSFEEVFDNVVYDVCINAAGNGSVPVSLMHPINDFEANCTDVIRILELIRLKNKNCKYLHISSAAVYGNPTQLPVKESADLLPLSPYGWHKVIAETICAEYHNLYKISVAIVRPFSIYGPGLHKQLFWDLFQKCKNSPVELMLWGTGNESRDFIYIDDLIVCLNLIIEQSPMMADVYNLANGIEITIKEAATEFVRNFNNLIGVNFNNETRTGDPVNWKADISKIGELGYKLKYNFYDGIQETVKWQKNLN